MIVLCILFALLILAVALFATIWIYLKMRKHFSRNRVLNEIIVIAFAIVVSFIIKGAVVLSVYGITDYGEGMAAVWYVLYATIGGLSFEGIDASAELGVSALLKCFYYGAAVYAAVTSLSIITVGVSYEFYTYVKVLLFPRTYSALYIFTDVSEESLLMAKSIYAEEKGKKRKHSEKFAVIFMGSGLEAFDRKSELHREIVNYGFYYLSYSKNHNPEKEVSLLKKLRYTKSRCMKKDNGANHNKMVHIFSLKSDENLYAAENLNSNLLFADMAAVLRDYCKAEGKVFVNEIPTVINYYVMTQSDVNYEFYKTTRSRKVKELIANGAYTGKDKEECEKEILNNFQIHILSEAQLYADDLSKQLREQATGRRWDAALSDAEIEKYRRLLMPDKDGFYRTAVYGFGKAGQHALSELFIAASSFCDGNYLCPSKFLADVYDGNMSEISGEFSYNHPMFICKNSYSETAPKSNEELYKWGKSVDGEAFRAVYNSEEFKKMKLPENFVSPWEMPKDIAYKLMGYPVIAMHESSCFEMDFMKDADSHTAGIYDKEGVSYRSFIISMGNDESNLLMANILIDDCRHEINLKEKAQPPTPVVIFVHIRDEKNTSRLNWTEDDKKNEAMSKNLVVVPFGCRKNIWSYKNIVDDDADSLFHYGYYLVTTATEDFKDGNNIKVRQKFDEFEDAIKQGKSTACGKEMVELIESSPFYKDLWLEADAFSKESNRSVCNFALNYCMVNGGFTEDYYNRLEHLRWVRFHMSNGWIYADYKGKEKAFRKHCKEHNNLCPYIMLDEDTQAKDMVNVRFARASRMTFDEKIRNPPVIAPARVPHALPSS